MNLTDFMINNSFQTMLYNYQKITQKFNKSI